MEKQSHTFSLKSSEMTVKRRNHGRNKHGRGHVNRVRWSILPCRCTWFPLLCWNCAYSLTADAFQLARQFQKTRQSSALLWGMQMDHGGKTFYVMKVHRTIRRNLVDPSALRDIKDASAFAIYRLPKLYIKQYYCVEAAVHQRIVRVRSAEDRKNREGPSRLKRGGQALRCSSCGYITNGIPPLHHDIMNEKGQRLTGKSCDGVFE